MSSIKEVFNVISDVVRALPVLLAKQPTSDDPASIASVFEDTVAVSYTHLTLPTNREV